MVILWVDRLSHMNSLGGTNNTGCAFLHILKRALEVAGVPEWMRILAVVKEMALHMWVGGPSPSLRRASERQSGDPLGRPYIYNKTSNSRIRFVTR